jgi:hypothetical protein
MGDTERAVKNIKSSIGLMSKQLLGKIRPGSEGIYPGSQIEDQLLLASGDSHDQASPLSAQWQCLESACQAKGSLYQIGILFQPSTASFTTLQTGIPALIS